MLTDETLIARSRAFSHESCFGSLRTQALACCALLALVAPSVARAEGPPALPPYDTMIDLGVLSGTYSYGTDLSDDGLVVTGYAGTTNDNWYHAFRWTLAGMQDLGTLGGSWSYSQAVSGNGRAIVGYSSLAGDGTYHAFRWTAAGGMQDLGTFSAGVNNYSYAQAVNVDGSVVVGYSYINSNSSHHAFRWTETGGMADLGTLGGTWSYAHDVSGDGTVVVGQSSLVSDSATRGFRWTQAGGMQDLGHLGGGWSYARKVSRDGSTVIGHSSDSSGHGHAFRWTQAGGMIDLGTFGGNYSQANAVSNDGSAVTGYAYLAGDSYHRAFLWTQAGGLRDLGTLGGSYSYGYDISGNGQIVTGYAYLNPSNSVYHAFRWSEEHGLVDLGTLGGTNSYGTSISDDGGTITGQAQNAAGFWRAFIHRTRMIDFTNMIASFGLTASDVELAGEAQRETASWLIDGGCPVHQTRRACVGIGGMFSRVKEDGSVRIARRHDEAIQGAVGVRLSPAITLGAGIGYYRQNDSLYSIKPGDGFHYGAWLDLAPGGSRATGLKLRAALAGAAQRNTIRRGEGLENVQVTPGVAELRTLTARGTLSYGIGMGGAVLTPMAGITWQRTKLDGFSESPGDFPAVFGQTRYETSYATAGVSMAFPLGEGSRFSLGAGADFDLKSDPVVMHGTSAIPGMESFAAPSTFTRKKTRARLDAGLEQDVGPGSFNLRASVRTPALGGNPVITVGVGLGLNI